MTDTMTYNWTGNAGGLSVGRRQSAAYTSSPLNSSDAAPDGAPSTPAPDDPIYIEPDAPEEVVVDQDEGQTAPEAPVDTTN